ncbi:MAG: gentisate 1,2-dioxygenase [Steroidobacteraceae bacterium]
MAPAAERSSYYAGLSGLNLAPLWEVLHELVPQSPRLRCHPALWRYDEVRSPLLAAGQLISAAEAVRRVLVLENPACPGKSRIADTLYAGLQLLLPGEIAPAHRHTQSALRFILEGQGAYTAVNGERAYMQPGDLILTPSWVWHDHGNDTESPVVWLDGLDIPLIELLGLGFAENYAGAAHDSVRPPGDAVARFGSMLLPADCSRTGLASPILSYPYARVREAIEQQKRAGCDPCHGVRAKYANPLDGGHVLPTLGAFLQLLPAGFRGEAYRSTDNVVFVAVEGEGRTSCGDRVFDWRAHDVFVTPGWHWIRHEAGADDAVLFSFSDCALQEKLGLWRSERGTSTTFHEIES